jgi:hypothetical protein
MWKNWFRSIKPDNSGHDDIDLNSVVAGLLESHGVPAIRHENFVFGADVDYPIEAWLPTDWSAERKTVQLDVRVYLGNQRFLIESFSGIGETRRLAIQNAVQVFCGGSFHVLLNAFWPMAKCVGCDDQVDIEEIDIGGVPFRMIIGGLVRRGSADVFLKELYPTIKSQLATLNKPADLMWFRFFHGQMGEDMRVTEVLRENDTWHEAEHAIRSLPWPKSPDYYSSRVFLIAQRSDAIDGSPLVGAMR